MLAFCRALVLVLGVVMWAEAAAGGVCFAKSDGRRDKMVGSTSWQSRMFRADSGTAPMVLAKSGQGSRAPMNIAGMEMNGRFLFSAENLNSFLDLFERGRLGPDYYVRAEAGQSGSFEEKGVFVYQGFPELSGVNSGWYSIRDGFLMEQNEVFSLADMEFVRFSTWQIEYPDPCTIGEVIGSYALVAFGAAAVWYVLTDWGNDPWPDWLEPKPYLDFGTDDRFAYGLRVGLPGLDRGRLLLWRSHAGHDARGRALGLKFELAF